MYKRQVVYIRAETPTETDIRVTGTISGLTLGQDAAITVITDGGRKITFQVDDETYISLDGQEEMCIRDRVKGQCTNTFLPSRLCLSRQWKLG